MKAEQTKEASSGVEALIQRLKEQGIAAGQEKAEQIVIDAQKRAEWIIEEAEREAQLLLNNARAEVEIARTAGQDALKLAARDAVLKLRDNLLGGFSREVVRAVGKEMAKEEFLRQLIIELAGRIRSETGLDNNQKIVIQIPDDIAGLEDLRRNPEKFQEGALSRFTSAVATDLLRAGVTIEVADDLSRGLLIKLEDDNMVIDFTDETVAALLLEHLQPRFRALLQGVVK
jgi:V/A-type H+-transporting ATPase subunit E